MQRQRLQCLEVPDNYPSLKLECTDNKLFTCIPELLNAHFRTLKGFIIVLYGLIS